MNRSSLRELFAITAIVAGYFAVERLDPDIRLVPKLLFFSAALGYVALDSRRNRRAWAFPAAAGATCAIAGLLAWLTRISP
jgi:hypothetical protein